MRDRPYIETCYSMHRHARLKPEDGCPYCLRDRISELEAPFILTDKVPTGFGLYFRQTPDGSLGLFNIDSEALLNLAKHHAAIGFKFSSAALPQPQEKNDE